MFIFKYENHNQLVQEEEEEEEEEAEEGQRANE